MENIQPQQLESIASGGAARVQSFATGVIDSAFWRAVVLIIVFFVMLALYRIFSARIDRSANVK
jgi:hypothetical protein